MRGSLAVWCETAEREIDGHSPRIELHFNMWLDLPKASKVLDVGFLFKEPRPIRRLLFYVPASLKLEHLTDLSDILDDDTTLSAVFNDTLKAGVRTTTQFEVRRGSQLAFRVIKIVPASHWGLQEIEERDGSKGTVISFSSSLFDMMNDIGDYYIRFRIHLKEDLASLFVSDFRPDDWLFLSAFNKTEFIEFRVNERRNFGEALLSEFPAMKMPEIPALHYFLVRNIGTELVQSHADFRKLRRLEPRLWDRYLNHLKVNADEMVIYHWRAGGEAGKMVDDFIAFSSFRKPFGNVGIFLAVILFFGVFGNVLYSAILDAIGLGTKKAGICIDANWVVFILFAMTVIGFYLWKSGKSSRIRRYLRFIPRSKENI